MFTVRKMRNVSEGHELLSDRTGNEQTRSTEDQFSLNNQFTLKLEKGTQDRIALVNISRPTLKYNSTKISANWITG